MSARQRLVMRLERSAEEELAASSAAKDSLAALPKEEVAALLNGNLRLAKPVFLRRMLDGTMSFLITDGR